MFISETRLKAVADLLSSLQDSVSRGDKFTLKSNSVNENWVLVSANGATKTFPGVCFLIPPPDPDSVDKVDT